MDSADAWEESSDPTTAPADLHLQRCSSVAQQRPHIPQCAQRRSSTPPCGPTQSRICLTSSPPHLLSLPFPPPLPPHLSLASPSSSLLSLPPMHHADVSLRWLLSWSCLSCLLLCLSLVQAAPQQTDLASGLLYYQSTPNGTLNLLLTGQSSAACGGALGSSAVQVQLVTGLLLGSQVSYVLPSGVDVQTSDGASILTPFTDNCLSPTLPYLTSDGLALSSAHTSVYQLSYGASSTYQLSPSSTNPQPPTSVLLLTPPPTVLSLTAPSAGLLFNSAFETVVSASTVGAPSDFAAGWTGGYTMGMYSAVQSELDQVAPPIPGEAVFYQVRFVYVNASLSQSTQPLLLGAPYNLTWYDDCIPTAGASTCQYSVTIGSTTATYTRSASTSWSLAQPSQLLPYTANGTDSPTPTLTFTAISGTPLIDSVLLAPAVNSSTFPIPTDPFQRQLRA